MNRPIIKEPYFLPGGEIGCVMIHGFGSSPGEVAGLGEILHQRGYTIKGVLLEGHGTTPKDLAKTNWRDWYASVERDIEFLRAGCSQVWLCGLSLGGALGLYAASQGRVDGLVAMAAPTGLAERKAQFANLASFLKSYQEINLTPNQEEFNQRAGRFVYLQLPLKAVGSLNEFIRIVYKNLPQVTIPTLIVHTKKDEVISPESGMEIYNKINSSVKELLLLEKSNHIVTESVEKEIVNERVVSFIQKYAPFS